MRTMVLNEPTIPHARKYIAIDIVIQKQLVITIAKKHACDNDGRLFIVVLPLMFQSCDRLSDRSRSAALDVFSSNPGKALY